MTADLHLPHDYYHCLLGNGCDAVLVGPTGRVHGTARNIAPAPLARRISLGRQAVAVALQPGEAQSCELAGAQPARRPRAGAGYST